MRLGFLTAPFPETPLMEVADWAAGNGFESPRDRLLAAHDRARPAATRARATSTSRTCRRAQADGDRRRDRRQGPDDLRARLLPEPAAPRPGASRAGHRPPQARHHRGREDGRPARQHVHGRRRRAHPGRQLGARARDLAGHRPVRPGPRAEDHHRELPDDLQQGRVAGRAQHRLVAVHLAADPRDLGRDDRAQLRPVAPRLADDRPGPLHPRVRAAHPALPGQGPDDRPRRAVRARHRSRRASAGRSRASPGSARSTGASCSRRSIGPAMPGTASSSTRTGHSKAPTSS